MFTQDNTTGYTDGQLAAVNAELAERVSNLTPNTDEYNSVVQAFNDEIASR